MSTELTTTESAGGVPAVIRESRIMALRPDSDYMEAITANEGMLEPFGVRDLIKAKVPAGGTETWVIDEMSGQESYKEIIGVPVFYKPTGAIWPSNESNEGTLPFIVTHDLVTGVEMGEDSGDLDLDLIESCRIGEDPATGKGLYDWPKLRKAFWAVDEETGKRVKEGRIICILRENDPLPLLLRVPPTSLKNITSFFKLAARSIALFRLVLSFSLEVDKTDKGIKYSKIRVKEVGRLSKEEGAVIKEFWVDRLGEAVAAAATSQDHDDDDAEITDDGEPFVA